MDFYEELKNQMEEIAVRNNILDIPIKVTGKILSNKEAIGTPKRKDFPLIKGKESLMEADFNGCKGQAFTDMPSNFSGSIKEIISLSLNNNKNRAIFIATLNALTNYLKISSNNIHCHDEEPEVCAQKLVKYIKDKFGDAKIGMVGFQPAMIDFLKKDFDIRILDLNPDNIGKQRHDVLIEDGEKDLESVINWADVILVTGSTIVNGTIVNFLNLNKPVIFFGTTIAGAAALMDLKRICFEGA